MSAGYKHVRPPTQTGRQTYLNTFSEVHMLAYPALRITPVNTLEVL